VGALYVVTYLHPVTMCTFCLISYAVNCRYLFALQVKRDLLTGALACQQHTAILLASYIVQGTCSVYFCYDFFTLKMCYKLCYKLTAFNKTFG